MSGTMTIFRREFARRLRGAVDAQAVFVDALQTSPELTTTFSPGYFSQALRQIARVIGARGALGASRQTFFITVGGWDHHDDVRRRPRDPRRLHLSGVGRDRLVLR